MKKCIKCNKLKSIEYFYKSIKCSDGYENQCKTCRSLKSKEWRVKNKEIVQSYHKLKYKSVRKVPLKTEEEKRNTLNKYKKEYYKNYYINNPSQKIAKLFRQRIWRILKGISVKYKIEDLIGCSKDFLKKHIEKQFKSGMSWENHNKTGWHIDHIKPCCKFDLQNDIELKECFNYRNLQPLWAIDNLRKNKY